MTSRAPALIGLLALGCGAERVDARAIWVDELGGEGSRRIHVYDRGERYEFEVRGGDEPVDRVSLDRFGEGVLVRAGERAGVWFDLDDGRRLPLLLPPSSLGGEPTLEFAAGALTWIDELDGGLRVVPLAAELALARDDDGAVEPLRRGAGLSWTVAATQAPIVLAARAGAAGSGAASFIRFPTAADDPLALALEAAAEGLSLPLSARPSSSCDAALACYARVALEPRGELAIFAVDPEGPWELFDRRAPSRAGPLALPEPLAAAAAGPGLRLLTILDREVSIWIGPGQLYRYDRARGLVDSLPLIAAPPLSWVRADADAALILSSSRGAVYRADLAGLRAVSLETTACAGASPPVVSPQGRWVAWTCVEAGAEQAQSGVVVRVSAAGLERFVGVPMATLAIDDAGDLLLYSVESSLSDELDGVGATRIPRSLFSLSGDGVLTRVDELEPAPAPVLLGTGELATYIQAVALSP